MRILVLATAARVGGALTVLRSLYDFARGTTDSHEWVFLVGVGVVPAAPGVEVVVVPELQRSRYRRLALDLGFGTGVITRHKPDVVVSLHNTMPPRLQCHTLLYIQQSIPFQDQINFSLLNAGERSLAIYQHAIGPLIIRSARACDTVVVQTRWMRDAVTAATGVKPGDIVVAPISMPDVRVPEDRPPFDPSTFIYPTNGAVYKNDRLILEALAQVPDARVTLTVAGQPQPQVEYAGRLPREELLRRLSAATLVFPSLFETVGLPLLEARSLGVPVLAADLPYAREVLEGYPHAAFFDPRDASTLAARMREVMRGELAPGPPSRLPDQQAGWEPVLKAIESFQ